GGSGGLLEAALLIGLFWAALAHPERIQSLIGFRVATILLGISIVFPVILQLFFIGGQLGGSGQPGAGPNSQMALVAGVSPVTTMLAVIFGVDSVTPRTKNKNAKK
ncbi:MAG: hypothetical protein P8J33_16405, partial [Pirellulaceae bacterium]|nr:hypothetical protein [Pirellulaceae bacterium]